MSQAPKTSLAVLTSGGDAPGMNAAVRAVVRTALSRGVPVYTINEGYKGMVDGGERICAMAWEAVGGMMQSGGTIIGSARCQEFRTPEGRLQAARNLIERGIDRLIVIGGDGSLTGANLFRQEWPDLLAELAAKGEIDTAQREAHPNLAIVGLVGSIDNDMFGTDMTIGADTALHRITEAIDAIKSTASSHRRTFVVEVMGRHCGYLTLKGGLAGAADWILIPEHPPQVDDWEQAMCDALRARRDSGLRDSIVLVAEGAQDRHGAHIESAYVQKVIEERLGHDVRLTILGHVQRGGAPSAFDRYMSSLLGYAAVEKILSMQPTDDPCLIGMRGNRIAHAPLMECVERTHALADLIAAEDYDQALRQRGGSFVEGFRSFRTLARALPHKPQPGQRLLRLAVLNAGSPAPGMNAATRVAVRLGIDRGHTVLGVRNGFQGLIDNRLQEMDWISVDGWTSLGGSELGTSSKVPTESEYAAIARTLERQQVQGMLVIGDWDAYESTLNLWHMRERFAAFNIPVICLPASINNDLPGSELSVGTDTAVNSIVQALDKIKQSAVATNRAFVVEVMGGDSGFLALMAGLASGAERVYLPEEGVTLKDMLEDVERLVHGFEHGRRLGLLIRSEHANPTYDTRFMRAVFDEEGGELFEVLEAILGHLQQGGDPTPFDRAQATLLATRCIEFLIERGCAGQIEAAFIGLRDGRVEIQDLEQFPAQAEPGRRRPKNQWWMSLRPIARVLARPPA